ncbi:MAG: helix-turn-helix domain-containing protein [Caulobacterales bacterium]|uniref:helix-turn-helix domain-containing protein n=1 Tax=Glycocaulis sp. TaxID=1969725 RepID=UPI003FA0A7A6
MRAIHDSAYQRSVQKLIEQRKAVNVTQADIALNLGRPQSFVSKYERFERRLDAVEYAAIASLLDMPLDDYLDAVGYDPHGS